VRGRGRLYGSRRRGASFIGAGLKPAPAGAALLTTRTESPHRLARKGSLGTLSRKREGVTERASRESRPCLASLVALDSWRWRRIVISKISLVSNIAFKAIFPIIGGG
jgi:hypothetical protein